MNAIAAALAVRPSEDGRLMCEPCAAGYCGRAFCVPADPCQCPCSGFSARADAAVS
jgi:hypothetical protein